MLGSKTYISTYKFDAISKKTIRYAIGIAIAAGIAFGYNYPLSFFLIIMANSFLQGPKPTLRFAFDFTLKFSVGVVFGVLLSNFFLEYEIPFLFLIGIIMLQLYYTNAISPFLKIVLIIMTLVIPLVSLQSVSLGSLVGLMIVVSIIIAFLITFLLHAILPDTEIPSVNSHPKAQNRAPVQSKKERFNIALKTFIVVYPLIVLFYYFNLVGSVVILIYVGMYANVPGISKNKAIQKDLLIGCSSGGIVAYLMYEILVITPVFIFFLLLIFGLTLWAGNETFTGGKHAATIKSGFSTVAIILGGAISSNEMDAGGKVLIRVLQITAVIIYIVIAFNIIEKLAPTKNKKALQ